jgi:hypothetical protein
MFVESLKWFLDSFVLRGTYFASLSLSQMFWAWPACAPRRSLAVKRQELSEEFAESHGVSGYGMDCQYLSWFSSLASQDSTVCYRRVMAH